MVRREAKRFAAAAALLLAGCGGGEPAMDDAEFRRRLRLGVEQLRRHLGDSARAELARCAEARPDDPEVAFHRARLALLPDADGPDEAEARELLGRVLEADSAHVAAHRMLWELDAARGDEVAAQQHRAAIESAYGPLGTIEMDQIAALERGGTLALLSFPGVGEFVPQSEAYFELRGGFGLLQRQGRYDPEGGANAIESVLRRYPDLVALRMHYARSLDQGQVRIESRDDPELPPMSSKIILDAAQSHFERAFDRVSPGSRAATEALRNLSRIAMQMADYEDAYVLKAVAREDRRLSEGQRRALSARMGLARYKQGLLPEAIELLEHSVSGARPQLAHLWLLHLAHEAAGTPPGERAAAFRFRADLERDLGPEPDFVDVAPELGIAKLDGLGPSAWGDYDGDGDFDLFVCGCDSYGALYREDGERFVDVSREAGLYRVQSGYSATFADYDDDGDPDLYVGRDGWNGPAANGLYRNEDGKFADVTAEAGVDHPGSSFVHLWSDVDRDGDLDLYVAGGITGAGDVNTLFRNEGGAFKDATSAAGLREPRGTKTIGLAVGDIELDGWPDLFASGYRTLNRLYRNKGDGTFEERAAEAGVDGKDHLSDGYVAFFVDVDNDLDQDILRTSLAPWEEVLFALSAGFDAADAKRRAQLLRNAPHLYRNDGDGTFTDATVAAGLHHPIGIMGAGVADLDNDGWVDLYFGTGDPDIGRLEPDRYYKNRGDGTFVDRTFASGLGNLGKGHGVTFVDRDGDGDLEIYAPEGGFVHGDPWANAFYDNRGASARWLQVDLEGTKSNRGAIGAVVIVTAGDLTVLRERKSGQGFGSTDAPTLAFGLGKAEKIDRVEIRWPSGAVQTFDDVPLDRRIFVREGERWAAR